MEEPRWFVRAVADVLHQRLIGQYGGSPGIRDPALVDSALARPVNRWAYSPGCDLADLAASTSRHGDELVSVPLCLCVSHAV